MLPYAVMISRRSLLQVAAVPAAAAAASAAASKNLVIASSNGPECCRLAMEMLQAGKDTLDAVVAGVTLVEDDPRDTSVGYGGLPNEEGVVELDASVMHGPSRRAGSVASLRNIRNPSQVARLVMTQTDHIMLVGEGALRFARAHGFAEQNLLTEQARLAWMVWKQSLRDAGGRNNWAPGLDAPDAAPQAWLRERFPGVGEEMLAWAWEVARHPPTGTISCLALNARGEMSGVTTTSGLAWKIPGRVGDSPIIGAGLYVDQDAGAAGSTGRGEENIRVAGAHTVVELMRQGRSAKEAVLETLRRVSRNYGDRQAKLGRFDLNFYALRKDGDYAGGSLWDADVSGTKRVRRQFAVNDGGASRLEDCVYLYERRP
jgi:N4-(beta-N-acetylglucosaminyl)-L-asparaginase